MFENYVLCDNQQSKHLNKNKMGYIYKITNKINNKIYIGKTENSIQHRFQEHIKTSRKSCSYRSHLYSAMREYGVDNFSIELVESCDERLDERERYWIKFYQSQNPDIGYNIHEGGRGGRTFVETPPQMTQKQIDALRVGWYLPASEKQKQTVKSLMTGRTVSEKTREKLRSANIGKVVSNETREKLSKIRKGKKLPPKTERQKDNIRQSVVGRKHIHKDGVGRFVRGEELQYYLSDGWCLGRPTVKGNK